MSFCVGLFCSNRGRMIGLSLCLPALDIFLGRLFVEETGSFVLWRVCVLDFSDGVFVVLFSLLLSPLQTGVLTMEGDTVSQAPPPCT